MVRWSEELERDVARGSAAGWSYARPSLFWLVGWAALAFVVVAEFVRGANP